MATVKKMKKAAYGEDMMGPKPKPKVVPMELRSDAEQKAFMAKASKENAENIKSNTANAEYFLKKRNAANKPMKNGGSLTGLKASKKRVGPVDPKGAYTKVQKKTLAGAKGKASLTKDKQLGATKMKKGGAMSKCKYGCN